MEVISVEVDFDVRLVPVTGLFADQKFHPQNYPTCQLVDHHTALLFGSPVSLAVDSLGIWLVSA